MKASATAAVLLGLASLVLAGCHIQAAEEHAEHSHHEGSGKIIVTSPKVEDVVTTQEYVCQIHSQRHIEIRALEEGYLQEIRITEGQAVKQGDLLFKINPVLYEARLASEIAKAQVAEIKAKNSSALQQKNYVSSQDVALAQAELAEAQAKVELARAELNFTNVTAPFDGIVDRLFEQQGSLVEEGDMLTNLSDNSVMWVYFNVPEARYLEYMAAQHQPEKNNDEEGEQDETERQISLAGLPAAVKSIIEKEYPKSNLLQAEMETDANEVEYDVEITTADGEKVELEVSGDGLKIEVDDEGDDIDEGDDEGQEYQRIALMLADGSTFKHLGKIGAIEANFNNETGNIPFRVDFPNPEGLLRHGQTGNVLINKTLKNALVIPQRATFEILDKLYVFVVDKDGIVHQRNICIEHEKEDIFVVKSGLDANDEIILDGIRQVRDGEKVEYEFRKPEETLANQKYHAE